MDEQNTAQPQPQSSPEKTQSPGRKKAILSIICAVIALGFFPPIFGIAGIILGYLARKEGEKTLGLIGIILSAVFMVLGFIIGAGVSIMLQGQGEASVLKGLLALF